MDQRTAFCSTSSAMLLVAVGAVGLTSCAASKPPGDEQLSVAVPGRPPPEQGDRDPASCVEVQLVEPSVGSRPALSKEQLAELALRIAVTNKAINDTQFRDADLLVERARLELERRAEESTSDGPNDVARGRKDAMRAVAVDDRSAPARLVLAISMADRVVTAAAGQGPHMVPALALVELAARGAIDGAAAPTAAAAETLIGFTWLDRGDAAAADQAFERALTHDPDTAAAWLGRGQVARSRKQLPEAAAAFRRALQLVPRSRAASLGLSATESCQGLALAQAVVLPLGLSSGALAPPPVAPQRCQAAQLADPRNEALCAGREALIHARAPDALRAGAKQVLRGYRELRKPCQAGDPVCGPHVAQALLEASHAYRSAGGWAQRIQASKLLLSAASSFGPGARKFENQAMLEIADAYFTLSVYDLAASFYERYARQAGSEPSAAPARQRAFTLRLALGEVAQAQKLVTGLIRARGPAEQRAAAVLAVGSALVSTGEGAAANRWLRRHERL